MNERGARREHIIGAMAGWGIFCGTVSNINIELDRQGVLNFTNRSFWASILVGLLSSLFAAWLLGMITWKLWGRKCNLMAMPGDIKTAKINPVANAILLLFLGSVYVSFLAVPMHSHGYSLPQAIFGGVAIMAVAVCASFLFLKVLRFLFVRPLANQQLDG